QNLCGLIEPDIATDARAIQRCHSRQCAWKIALTLDEHLLRDQRDCALKVGEAHHTPAEQMK
ncbi:hypothetical protein, partial [Ensifer sp. Root127]|uniref:hypothetical protein n=1 Tax=Ensifer sp. Root127 TaxID=1736440 RepID=UPI001AECD0A3